MKRFCRSAVIGEQDIIFNSNAKSVGEKPSIRYVTPLSYNERDELYNQTHSDSKTRTRLMREDEINDEYGVFKGRH